MEGQEQNEGTISKGRLEALFDGIYAFAMTLLVTGLVISPIPKTLAQTELPARLSAMHPEFLSFLISFFVLASFWLVHHTQFRFVRTVDRWLMRITLFILVFTVLIPFTTNVSGDYSDVQAAVDLFHINMFILGTLFLVHWWYLVKNPRITTGRIGEREAARGIWRCTVVPAVSLAGLLFSFAEPSLSMAAYILIIPAFLIVDYRFPA